MQNTYKYCTFLLLFFFTNLEQKQFSCKLLYEEIQEQNSLVKYIYIIFNGINLKKNESFTELLYDCIKIKKMSLSKNHKP